MKKTLSVILIALLLAIAAGGMLAVQAACNCGDIDGDGKINVDDILIIREIIFGLLKPNPEAMWASDVNEDGVVDIYDILAMRDIIFGAAKGDLKKPW